MRMRLCPMARLWLDAATPGALVTLLAASAAIVSAQGEETAAPARLSNLVRQDCGSCHGLTLKGGLGKPLTAESLQAWDRDQLAAIILDGVPGMPMPPWRALLTETDARLIADMLKEGALK